MSKLKSKYTDLLLRQNANGAFPFKLLVEMNDYWYSNKASSLTLFVVIATMLNECGLNPKAINWNNKAHPFAGGILQFTKAGCAKIPAFAEIYDLHLRACGGVEDVAWGKTLNYIISLSAVEQWRRFGKPYMDVWLKYRDKHGHAVSFYGAIFLPAIIVHGRSKITKAQRAQNEKMFYAGQEYMTGDDLLRLLVNRYVDQS